MRSVVAAPGQLVSKRAQTVYLAGDSTMAKAAGVITGWGVYVPYSLSLPVINKAIGGRSSRSFTVEGRFTEIISLVQPNDIVIMEFGHNDGGSLSSGTDNGRTVCPGTGNETCTSTYNGTKVTVHTFPYYLTQAGKALIAKGAKVIVSSQTPNNPWESGSFQYTDGGRFVGYAKDVARALGSNAQYVDHGAYAASIWKIMGKAQTDRLFPQDHTHTSPEGAAVVAKAFVKAVQCGGGGFLKGFVRNATESIPGVCL
ncbi:rhamnogalacturonan acetylesterase [Pyrenophora seminiperda CCB06]|uniref:Rhamnogalacturonan acetylesterase n=1 Tax=Pyrenophora seminiperda CCB06 TaxID=1302712 RepID=A0A3M7MB83_9PLEO|nr:rhamnogalacturonan acetylesterase [Pyrenophora seminiperda CCB06]